MACQVKYIPGRVTDKSRTWPVVSWDCIAHAGPWQCQIRQRAGPTQVNIPKSLCYLFQKEAIKHLFALNFMAFVMDAGIGFDL